MGRIDEQQCRTDEMCCCGAQPREKIPSKGSSSASTVCQRRKSSRSTNRRFSQESQSTTMTTPQSGKTTTTRPYHLLLRPRFLLPFLSHLNASASYHFAESGHSMSFVHCFLTLSLLGI